MIIIGAKGFAKELLTVIYQNNTDENFCLYDDVNNDMPDLLYDKYKIIKNIDSAEKYIKSVDNRFLLGIGNPILRYNMVKKFSNIYGVLTSTIAQSAKIGNFDNQIGIGTNIMSNVIIEASNQIGMGCIIHTNSFISHDISIGNFCEISPSVNLLGNVEIGNFTSIGTGAIILPKIKIGENVIVGAGAVITKNIPNNSVVVGNPGRILRQLNALKI